MGGPNPIANVQKNLAKIKRILCVVLRPRRARSCVAAFPPRNLPKKFRPDPSTSFYLVIVVTDKQTNKQTDKRTPVIP